MDYVLNVYRDNEFLFAIGGKHMNYDNIIWWQLEELMKVVIEYENLSKEHLVNKIKENTTYFRILLDKPQKYGCTLDITNKTITIDHVHIYDFDEATFYNCGRELRWIGNSYYVQYEGMDELFNVAYAEFDLELLTKEILTFDEMKNVAGFINNLISEDKTDVILNNEKYLLLSEI